jgi:outer membrane protein assembly factor BamB
VADNSVATDENRLPPPPAGPPRARSASDAALDRYRDRMRRSRAVYYVIIAVVVAALGTWVGVVWSTGEAAHASLHTFATPPQRVPLGTPSQNQAEAWRSADQLAIGVPQAGGTLVTYSRHTVGGRDARTGNRTWTYTRTDRDVCTAAQFPGTPGESSTTIAVYAKDGNCDEVSAFDSQTGRRHWTRTLDMDGMPLNGHPAFQATPFTLMVTSHAVIYALDPVTGYNRWTYTRVGCRINEAVLGSAGALISQNCSDEVQCSGIKFCGRGPQLLLRDGSNGRDDDNKANADRIKWNQLADQARPASADDVVSAVNTAANRLQLLDTQTGHLTHSIPLGTARSAADLIAATPTSDGDVIWTAGRTLAVRQDASAAEWRTAAPSPPVVVSASNGASPELSGARITVPTESGIAMLDGDTGKVSKRFPVGAPAAGSLVYPLGTGFVVAAPTGIVAYR